MAKVVIKSTIMILLALAIMLSPFATVATAAKGNMGQFEIPEIYMNGEPVKFQSETPTYVDGELWVPVRELFEAFGSTVEWDNKKRQAFVTCRAVKIYFKTKTGDIEIYNNLLDDGTFSDEPTKIKKATEVVGNYTMAKLESIGEIFQLDYNYTKEGGINIRDREPLTVEIGGKSYGKTKDTVDISEQPGELVQYTVNGLEIRRKAKKFLWIFTIGYTVYVESIDGTKYLVYTKD